MISLKPPDIRAETAEEQIQQLNRYLYQLVQELNWALQTLETMAKNKEGR